MTCRVSALYEVREEIDLDAVPCQSSCLSSSSIHSKHRTECLRALADEGAVRIVVWHSVVVSVWIAAAGIALAEEIVTSSLAIIVTGSLAVSLVDCKIKPRFRNADRGRCHLTHRTGSCSRRRE